MCFCGVPLITWSSLPSRLWKPVKSWVQFLSLDWECGSASHYCGKPMAFRWQVIDSNLNAARLSLAERKKRKRKTLGSERRSLSAIMGGRAAGERLSISDLLELAETCQRASHLLCQEISSMSTFTGSSCLVFPVQYLTLDQR